MIGIKPTGNTGNLVEIRDRANAAAQVADVDAIPLLLFRRAIP